MNDNLEVDGKPINLPARRARGSGFDSQDIPREDEEGRGYALRRPPEYEAQILDYARALAVLVDFGALRCPVKVIGADLTLPYSYLPSLDLSEILGVKYDYLPEPTHFLQPEKPQGCAEELHQFLRSIPFT